MYCPSEFRSLWCCHMSIVSFVGFRFLGTLSPPSPSEASRRQSDNLVGELLSSIMNSLQSQLYSMWTSFWKTLAAQVANRWPNLVYQDLPSIPCSIYYNRWSPYLCNKILRDRHRFQKFVALIIEDEVRKELLASVTLGRPQFIKAYRALAPLSSISWNERQSSRSTLPRMLHKLNHTCHRFEISGGHGDDD